MWAPLLGGHAVVARAEAGPWSMGRACRQRLGREPTTLVRALHGFVFFIVALNLHSGLAMLLYLGNAFLGLDVTFADQFASVSNPMYDVALLALSAVVLEPVKVALGLLLVVDARVRSEGLDLQAAAEQLKDRPSRGAAAALALVAAGSVLALAAPAHAIPEAHTLKTLDSLIAEARLQGDFEMATAREQAAKLEGAQALALQRFVERLRAAREHGLKHEDLAAQLRQGLQQAREIEDWSYPSLDARSQARAILAREEFAAPLEKAKAEEQVEKKPSGFWAKLREWLDWLWKKIFGEREPDPRPPMSLPGLGAGVFEVVTWALIALAVGAVLYLVLRTLARERRSEVEAESAPAAPAPAEGGVLSALSRSPRGWLDEAERLAAAGNYREAVRAVYLAALAKLHRRGLIDYHPAKSNWDYVRGFRGALEQVGSLKQLTLCFDFAWYGRLGADPAGFERARTLATSLLGPEEAAADA
jgi:hypothetical protein